MIARHALLVGAIVLAGPSGLLAQDTLVIRRGEIPSQTARLYQWAVDVFNASSTTRVVGALTIDRDARYTGDVAVLNGPLVVEGTITGRLVAINADVEIRSGASIGGDVVVLGGTVRDEPSAHLRGTLRTRNAAAPVRLVRDRLELIRPPREPGLPGLRRRFVADSRFSVVLGFGGTYNRVEGLPIELGGQLRFRSRDVSLNVRGYGVFRTAGDFKGVREDIGYNVEGALRFGYASRVTLGARYFDLVRPTQEWPLRLNEVGWGTFLWHRDYRDYFLQRGVAGFLEIRPFPTALSITAEIARVDERSIGARDPWTLFRNDEEWRENPAVDEGDFTLISAALQYDSRPAGRSRSSGWFARVGWDRGMGDGIIAQVLPASVRDPLPIESYTYDRASVDLRRYQRVGWHGQLRLRAFWAGTVGDDPLPIQRRYSLGGPDPMNGYAFRAFACNDAVADSLFQPALCDHVLLFQAEYRGHVGFAWLDDRRDHSRALENLGDGGGWDDWFWISGPTLVLFSNAGTGWLAGDDVGSLDFDIGAGIEMGSLGFYVAKAVKKDEPVRVTLRIERRF